MLGVWSGATDGYDSGFDWQTAQIAGGYAGIYHPHEVSPWDGPTGYYGVDRRTPLWPTEAKTWAPLRTWAVPSYADATMSLAFLADPNYPPPDDRTYTLELLSVPPGVPGAPPIGTTWILPRDEETGFAIELPTYRAETGVDAYELAFTIGAANLPGDMDGNGVVDFDDVGPFVLGLNDPGAFLDQFGLPPADRGDMDTDGDLDFDDINRFAMVLTVRPVQTVAEPSSVALLIAAVIILQYAVSRGRSGRYSRER